MRPFGFASLISGVGALLIGLYLFNTADVPTREQQSNANALETRIRRDRFLEDVAAGGSTKAGRDKEWAEFDKRKAERQKQFEEENRRTAVTLAVIGATGMFLGAILILADRNRRPIKTRNPPLLPPTPPSAD